jgi:hypothetical protein
MIPPERLSSGGIPIGCPPGERRTAGTSVVSLRVAGTSTWVRGATRPRTGELAARPRKCPAWESRRILPSSTFETSPWSGQISKRLHNVVVTSCLCSRSAIASPRPFSGWLGHDSESNRNESLRLTAWALVCASRFPTQVVLVPIRRHGTSTRFRQAFLAPPERFGRFVVGMLRLLTIKTIINIFLSFR